MEKSVLKKQKEQNAKIRSETIYLGKKINLSLITSTYDDGTSKKTELVEHGGAVLIIPITGDNKIVFIKQYRKAIDKILIELPAGTLEKNELPKNCADRELREETGLKANKLTDFGGFFSTPGFCTEYIHMFIGQNLEQNPLIAEDTDNIDIIHISLKDALDKIKTGEIIDAKTIIAIYKYLTMCKK